MSITRSGIVLALCVLSQTVQGAETRRAPPSGRVPATKTPVTVKRTPTVSHDHRAVSFEDASKAMAPYKQWMIGANKTGFVLPRINRGDPANGSYNLKGSAIRKFLQYEKQGTWQGINLGWTDNASASTATKRAQWSFRRQFDQNEAVPIVYGERLSLAWGTGNKPYVKYASRNVGIDLDWSSKPTEEWAILGGKPGTRVKRGQDWVIIVNLKHRRPLVYYDRTIGGDIGWGNAKTEDLMKPLLPSGLGTWWSTP